MISIINSSTDPCFNLATEEYIMDSFQEMEKYLMLWQNQPSIIVGKHQNTIEEINAEFVREKNLSVVRRLSGGGAVYHDLGNLNFTFILDLPDSSLQFDFKRLTEPIIATLSRMGIPAEFNSRNDLTIEGKKFSGNAQFIRKGRCLHHGTLLFDTNLDDLEQALRVGNDKIESKGIKSIRSRVTNIKPYAKEFFSIEDFKNLLIDQFQQQGETVFPWILGEGDRHQISKLADTKYRSWEWNYGESPFFTIKKICHFEFGKIEAWLDVKQGSVNKCRFYGDFFGRNDKIEIEKRLMGCRYEENCLVMALHGMTIGNYFQGMTIDRFIQFLVE